MEPTPSDASTALIDLVTTDTAQGFLSALDLTQERWFYLGAPTLTWLFRGQRNSNWKLIPSVFRGSTLPQTPWDEFERIQKFISIAAQSGLDVPGDGPGYRDEPLDLVEELKEGRWPPYRIFPALAIAQHHRIPTRLLDWTYRPRVAAYFGAVDTVLLEPSKKEQGENMLAVWAFAVELLGADFDTTPGDKNDRQCQLTTAPYATNPNLSAQGGVFTLDRTLSATFVQPFENVLQARERLYWKKTGIAKHTTLVRKVTVPQAAAPQVLRLLRQDGISGASIFPGYDGVVRVIQEEEPRYK